MSQHFYKLFQHSVAFVRVGPFFADRGFGPVNNAWNTTRTTAYKLGEETRDMERNIRRALMNFEEVKTASGVNNQTRRRSLFRDKLFLRMTP